MSEKRKGRGQQILANYFLKKSKIESSAISNDISISPDDMQETVVKASGPDPSLNAREEEKVCRNPTSNTNEIEILAADISNYVSKSNLSNEDKITVLKNIWEPYEHYNFPSTVSGAGSSQGKPRHSRKFCSSWLRNHNWLAYSKVEDSAYCKFCVLFSPHEVGLRSRQATGQLVTKGFNNWKKALDKFREHETFLYHKNSVLKADEFLKVTEGKKLPVDQIMDRGKQKKVLQNRAILKPIIKTVIFCGRQGLAMRGHRDYGDLDILTEPSQSEGNFRALLRLRVDAGEKILETHLQSCAKNATYISWNIQNQIISSCNDFIMKQISTEVNEAKCFAVLADETTDIATIEQMTLCVRYLKRFDIDKCKFEFKIVENFLKFVPLTETTGRAIADAILKGLADCNIDTSFLRGQGFDGASAMSGEYNGAQAIIYEQHPKAPYVHCASHCLNLAITYSSRVPAIRNSFGTIGKISSFFNTPKRNIVLTSKINAANQGMTEISAKKLKKLCPTRWIERHDAVTVMVSLFDQVIEALEEISTWKDVETSTEAHTLLCSILKSEFVIALFSADKLLSYSVRLSVKLQEVNLDLATAVSDVEDIVKVISTIRENSEIEFHHLFEQAVKKLQHHGENITTPRFAVRQIYRTNFDVQTPEEYYRLSIFLPWIDNFITHLREKFLKHKEILQSFVTVIPKGRQPTQEENEKFVLLSRKFANDLELKSDNTLKAELHLWYMKVSALSKKTESPIELLNFCDEKSSPTVFELLKVYATLPVSTSSAERSFSTMKRLKSYLRNTMSENRLNGLAAMNIHREVEIDPDQIINALAAKNRRLDFVL